MVCPGSEAVSRRPGIRTPFLVVCGPAQSGPLPPPSLVPVWPSETKIFLRCTVGGSLWDIHRSLPVSGFSDSGWPETPGEDRNWYPRNVLRNRDPSARLASQGKGPSWGLSPGPCLLSTSKAS